MDDGHHPILRAVLASALISATLTLPVSGALAQMSDMKKMPGMNDSKMSDTKMSDTKKTKTADATGTITALNAANHKITFDHGPIPAIDWPAMKRSKCRPVPTDRFAAKMENATSASREKKLRNPGCLQSRST